MISALSRARWRTGLCSLACRGFVAAVALLVPAMPGGAAEFAMAPGQQVIGAPGQYATRKGDVFPDIARRFDLGYTEFVAANPGIDPWVPGVGQAISIPSLFVLPAAPHQGIVINLAQSRLFYFPAGGGKVETYPIGLGVIGRATPIGATRIVRKQAGPAWYPPASIRAEHAAEGDPLPAVVPAGPDNPLGAFALYLGWPSYLIHGTNKPDGVGRYVSHGCMRLYPEDIAKLFEEVPVGTPVHTVNQPVVAGWSGNKLLVSVYPTKQQADELDTERPAAPKPVTGAEAVVRAAAGQYADAVDWRAVARAASERTGVPVVAATVVGGVAAAEPAEPAEPRQASEAAAEQQSGSEREATVDAPPVDAPPADAPPADAPPVRLYRWTRDQAPYNQPRQPAYTARQEPGYGWPPDPDPEQPALLEPEE